MVVNRVQPGHAGIIEWLVDAWWEARGVWLLNPLIAGVFAATVIQGIHPFSSPVAFKRGSLIAGCAARCRTWAALRGALQANRPAPWCRAS
jgi:hypothetical protein